MINHDVTRLVVIGSVCIMIAQVLTGLNQVVIKLSKLPIVELLMGRFATQLLIAAFWWNVKKPSNPKVFTANNDNVNSVKIVNWYGDRPYILNVWIRGIFVTINHIGFWYGVVRLPLGDLLCIQYQSPLFVVFFAFIVLKEKLPNIIILISAVVLTTCGIMLVSQPSFLLNNSDNALNVDGIVSMFIGAVAWAFASLLVRTATDVHFLQIEMVSSVCVCFLGLPALLLVNNYILHIDFIGDLNFFGDDSKWVFDLGSLGTVIMLGMFGFSSLSLSVIGYQSGAATLVSWLEYTTIPIGFMYQTLIFNDAPNGYEITGAILVVVGCLLPVGEQIFIDYKKKYLYHTVNTDNVSSEDSETALDENEHEIHQLL